MTSAVLILPAAYRQAGNDLSAEMGWQPVDADPGTYSVPLMTADVLTVMIYDFRVTGDPHTHFMDILAQNGLALTDNREI